MRIVPGIHIRELDCFCQSSGLIGDRIYHSIGEYLVHILPTEDRNADSEVGRRTSKLDAYGGEG